MYGELYVVATPVLIATSPLYQQRTGQSPVMAEDPLDNVVTEKDIAIIAQEHLTKWEEISPFLELKDVTDDQIRRTPGGYAEQKKALLREWKRLHSNGATFRALIRAAEEAQNMLLADKLRCMARQTRLVKSSHCTRTRLLWLWLVFSSVYCAGSSDRDTTDLPEAFTEGI